MLTSNLISVTVPGADMMHTMPDVWAEESTGLDWCDCGCHSPLTRIVVREFARDVLGPHLPERVTHQQVVRIAMALWRHPCSCRFFAAAIDDAAVRVNGRVALDYPFAVGLAIVKAFSNRWHGCPAEGC